MAARIASDTTFEIGIGAGIGVWRSIVTASRTPRRTRWSWSMNADSHGAGGHLKNPPSMPITIRRRRTNRSLGELRGAGDGVELVAPQLDEAGRERSVNVSAERHDQDVGVEHPDVGHDTLACGSMLVIVVCTNIHVRLVQLGVGRADLLQRLVAEQHVDLGEAEDEGVALVDEGQHHVVGQGVGEACGRLRARRTRLPRSPRGSSRRDGNPVPPLTGREAHGRSAAMDALFEQQLDR